ncbi:MAG: hypothetical protein IH845_01145 [Nanoarchaeota archaeon]|nr:hypothetical protein [Nanoarchaeota archaeon]
MENGELSPRQFTAIKGSIDLGRTLTEEHPEIANLYREGSSIPQIVEELDIQSRYDVTGNIAWSGVQRAISGHESGFNSDPYEGLIPDTRERGELAKDHNRKSGLKSYEMRIGAHGRTAEQTTKDNRRAGRKTYQMGVGIHAQTSERLSELGRKGGRKAYEEGLGMFGRTSEQTSEDSHKGGYNATLNRGQIPWVIGRIPEVEYAYALTFLPEFQKDSSRVNNKLIALELNIEYHDCEEVRTVSAVRSQLSKYRKSLEEKV